ncbi:hypothetical protein ATL41_1583 [Flavimobilis soli]|uniref:Uncharacterized protein n=1 Tax=Flavimobilis soli TaxID=442709 RepID=A0A2A9ED52_9MICO|nr:hypothetical protein [Flavimobilis soli]PFG36844.1 hypothetical protein ATL41_1583 [Flavimobilis soli]
MTLPSRTPDSTPSEPAVPAAGSSSTPANGDHAEAQTPRPVADVPKPSFVQIAASVLTAITSTVALSYLGVAGTLIGAAVAAVLTAVANYLYTRSLVRTRYVVTTLAPRVVRVGDTAVLPAVRGARTTAVEQTVIVDEVRETQAAHQDDAAQATPAPSPTVSSPSATASAASTPSARTPEETAAVPAATSTPDAPTAAATPPTAPVAAAPDAAAPAAAAQRAARSPEALMAPARRSRRPYVVTALVTFVIVIAAVTAVELGFGKPLSDVVRGQEGSGTTISGVRPNRGTPAQKPTPTPTQEAPAPTDEPTTEPTESPEPTPTPTDVPSPTPTTPAPTAPPTSTPSPTDAPTQTAPPVTPTPDTSEQSVTDGVPGAEGTPGTEGSSGATEEPAAQDG